MKESGHRPLANFSCHLPLAAEAACADGSVTSSMVSCSVDMAFRRWAGISSGDEVAPPTSAWRRMRALDVFFWRRPHDCVGVFKTADVEPDSIDMLHVK